jgi:EAL domain-containing protein (putative c-di-GMP-specific phosphodiesterase class I)
MGARIWHRRRLEADLRHAIGTDQITLFYGRSSRARPARLRLRWHHPIQGAIAPADFIPIVEETLR